MCTGKTATSPEPEVALNLLSSFGKLFRGQIFLAGGDHYSVAE